MDYAQDLLLLDTRLESQPPRLKEMGISGTVTASRAGLIRFAPGRVLVFHGGVSECSSRMTGNLQVRFLEGWAPAMVGRVEEWRHAP